MPSYTSDGLVLSYRDLGSGPALVLIHGWGNNGGEWESTGWTSFLGAGRRLLIPDVRGHGGSAKPHDVEAYRMPAMAADVAALLDAVGEPDADVFGYSMGGGIALWTAVLVPGRVRSLIAGGVTAGGPDAAVMGPELRGRAPLGHRASIYRDYAESMGETDFEALGACMETGLQPPPCVELAVYGGEALMVAGTEDRRRMATEGLAACLPGGRFVLLDGADHMGAFLDVRFHRAARDFLEEVSPV